jgi:hypothetical protein
MNRKDVFNKILKHFDGDLSGTEILLAEGFDDAFIGLGQQFDTTVAIYDRNKCIEILIKQNMTDEEAIVFFEYNVTGAYMGKNTPVFVELF